MKRALGRVPGVVAHLPVRWRLALGVGFTALTILLVVGLAVERQTEHHLVALLDDSLREEAVEMVPPMLAGREFTDFSSLVHDDDDEPVSLLLQALDEGGRLVGATPEARHLTLLAGGPDEASGDPGFTTISRVGRIRRLAIPASIRDTPYTLIISAVPYAPTARTMADLHRRLVGGALLGVALSAALAYGLAGAALRPVEQMRQRALEIRSSSTGVRLPLPAADDEVRRLGETLNHTLDELEAAATRRRLFVAHASHELRTPLARMRTSLELARRPQRTEEELRAAIEDAAVDTEELIALAEGLLDLGSLEGDPARPAPSPCEVSAVVGELADATPAIVTSVVSPAWAAIDPDALRRVLQNLVINAEVHGCPPIVVEVDLEDDRVTLVVWDFGPGMPAGFEDGAFEPFTRAPAAGGRPGAGLGLAIVATIVERYGGICSVRRDQGRFGVQIDVPAVSGPLVSVVRS
ncbi:MAG: HAMP domain-containing sensor histidine kinase [Acidimicrobiales bacterium]